MSGQLDKVAADLSRIPAPPEGAEGEEPQADATAVAKAKADNPLVAALRFVAADAMAKTIPLECPFEWDGTVYSSVTARKLTYAEVTRVYERAKDGDGEVKLIEFYAEMTGLPAAVIRGMESGDAQAVVEGCYPFLPRQLRSETSPSTSQSGGA